MAQTFSVSTTAARQDNGLAHAAAKAGQTVDQYVQAQFARCVQRAVNERDQDDGAKVAAAYGAATNATQAAVRTALGL